MYPNTIALNQDNGFRLIKIRSCYIISYTTINIQNRHSLKFFSVLFDNKTSFAFLGGMDIIVH